MVFVARWPLGIKHKKPAEFAIFLSATRWQHLPAGLQSHWPPCCKKRVDSPALQPETTMNHPRQGFDGWRSSQGLLVYTSDKRGGKKITPLECCKATTQRAAREQETHRAAGLETDSETCRPESPRGGAGLQETTGSNLPEASHRRLHPARRSRWKRPSAACRGGGGVSRRTTGGGSAAEREETSPGFLLEVHPSGHGAQGHFPRGAVSCEAGHAAEVPVGERTRCRTVAVVRFKLHHHTIGNEAGLAQGCVSATEKLQRLPLIQCRVHFWPAIAFTH